MGLMEFLAAMRQAAAVPEASGGAAAPAGRSPDEAISVETAPEDAGALLEGYFRRLREADR